MSKTTDEMLADIEAILNEVDEPPEEGASVRGAPTLHSRPATLEFAMHDPIMDGLIGQMGSPLPSAENASEPVHRLGADATANEIRAYAQMLLAEIMGAMDGALLLLRVARDANPDRPNLREAETNESYAIWRREFDEWATNLIYLQLVEHAERDSQGTDGDE